MKQFPIFFPAQGTQQDVLLTPASSWFKSAIYDHDFRTVVVTFTNRHTREFKVYKYDCPLIIWEEFVEKVMQPNASAGQLYNIVIKANCKEIK